MIPEGSGSRAGGWYLAREGEPLELLATQRQLRHGPLGHQATRLHDQHLVEVFEQVQAMNGGNDAGVPEYREEICVHPRFGRGIETRCGFIQQHETAASRLEHHMQAARSRVGYHVRQRFLGDPVHSMLDLGGEGGHIVLYIVVESQPGPFGCLHCESTQGQVPLAL